MGEKRNAHCISVAKPEGKTSLGRPRHRWENIIKTHLKISEGRFSIGGRGVLF
jgi:hypothetical protein